MKNKEKYIDDIIEVMKDHSKGCHFRAKRMFRNEYGECPAEISCNECNIKFYQWLEEEYEPPKVDWKSVPMNTIIEARGSNGKYIPWHKTTFVFYDENSDYPYVCINEAIPPKAIGWKYARLLEEN